MEEPENIVAILEQFFAEKCDLAGKKILITAGPTYERIDPVRFIGNFRPARWASLWRRSALHGVRRYG